MKQTTKKKFLGILTATLYLGAVISICVTSVSIMNKSYFNFIYVSGGSMNPTLKGGHEHKAIGPSYNRTTGEYTPGDLVNFGSTDESYRAKKNIKRYDIITTYYPWEDYQRSDGSGELLQSAPYKIKRVIALPGETFKITQGDLYIKENDNYTMIERTYLIDDGGNPSIKDVEERTLGENEYWVMGDHRSNSSDCVTSNRPVRFKDITGVLVVIEGVAEYFEHYHCYSCKTEVDDLEYLKGNITSCPKCGGAIVKGKGDVRNRQYTYPDII